MSNPETLLALATELQALSEKLKAFGNQLTLASTTLGAEAINIAEERARMYNTGLTSVAVALNFGRGTLGSGLNTTTTGFTTIAAAGGGGGAGAGAAVNAQEGGDAAAKK
ncbi:hypothetical protein K504DRAFT_508485 [Pleomassaria siparia CBS 279.74]|uniref:Uncharacterized protein n=1 Tax=Pleomassaria siparia CBS 279.74 TaxID=1314801 RepID=A0A6G1JRA7_9PLEO|nr:hypothetical protein K504DRAFT_508485 [Pleomassaria siparia CBS 279.74]